MDFLAKFRRFSPFLEDLGPFLKPDLRGKLGVCYQIQTYINQRLLKPRKEIHIKKILMNC
jgi:hypothetical protein